MTKPTTAEIIAKVQEIAENECYEVYGIRTQATPFELGWYEGVSKHWEGRIEDAEAAGEIIELDGICATSILDAWGDLAKDGEKLASLHSERGLVIRDGYGEFGSYTGLGNHVAILAGDDYEMGMDPGEVIIRDATVLHIFC